MTARPTPPLRRKPSNGTVIRMRLADGFYAYGCVTLPISIRVYGFLTVTPATGNEFFRTEYWKFAARLGDLPTSFVNCGRVILDPEEWGANPKFYEELKPDQAAALGFKYVQAVYERDGYRELSPAAIIEEKRHKKRWLEWHNHNEIFNEWRPQMEIREVPAEFVDKKALAGEPVTAKELPPEEVELVIIFPLAELGSDDPELDFEEPLEEALGEAECGEIGGSGTAPGVFEINVDTTRADLKKCLGVIRRVLKRLKVPLSTVIRQVGEPSIDHPLEPPSSPSRGKPRK